MNFIVNKKTCIILIICIFILTIILFSFYINNKQPEVSKVSEYNSPIIPNGFSKVETENASWELNEYGVPKGWNNGLVIEDTDGNQFVWVPVDGTNVEYKRKVIENKGTGDLKFLTHLPNDILDEYTQITKYGGFYIGRYEAGLPKELLTTENEDTINANNTNTIGKPIIKSNSIVWNNIDASRAINSAEQVCNVANVKSGLVTLAQWYTTMNWLENSGYNVNTDSKDWGNYSNSHFTFTGWYSLDGGKSYKYGKNKSKSENSMLLSTGATNRNMSNNIYDLAGNVYEYTSTYTSWANTYAYVGGYYDNSSLDCANKDSLYFDASSKIGFRVALFIG